MQPSNKYQSPILSRGKHHESSDPPKIAWIRSGQVSITHLSAHMYMEDLPYLMIQIYGRCRFKNPDMEHVG